jgi:DNA-directed RNA polymerase specialized sigma24 family protein
MTYNGWTNYETWAVKLWMDNEQGSYNYWREATQEAWEHPARNQFIDSHRDRARLALADRLKDEHEENAPTSEASIYTDLLSAALSEVNWNEIADSLLDDAIENGLISSDAVEEGSSR